MTVIPILSVLVFSLLSSNLLLLGWLLRRRTQAGAVEDLNRRLAEQVQEHDSTERRLVESEQRFARAVQGSMDGIWA